MSTCAAMPSVLVTGAAVRVGRAIALEFAARGWDVRLHYRGSAEAAERTADEIRALGREARLVQGDQAADPAEIVRRAAPFDALVCSAAAFEKAPALELSRAQFEAMLATNLTGPFLLAQAAHPHLARARGAIVNLLDLCGTSQVWKGYAHYAAAKAGLAALTRLLALEWAPDVRVNGVAPGTVLFPESLDDTERDRIRRRIPLGHEGTPGDVARAVFFLATEPFVTGQILAVDGGRTQNP